MSLLLSRGRVALTHLKKFVSDVAKLVFENLMLVHVQQMAFHSTSYRVLQSP